MDRRSFVSGAFFTGAAGLLLPKTEIVRAVFDMGQRRYIKLPYLGHTPLSGGKILYNPHCKVVHRDLPAPQAWPGLSTAKIF